MSENSERFCICISDLKQDRNTKAALLSETKWQSGDVIKIKFLEGDESLQQRVRETAEAWTGPDMADLKFEWVDEGDADIRIAFEQGNGSWSYLGTVCRQIPDNEPTMNYGWLTPTRPTTSSTALSSTSSATRWGSSTSTRTRRAESSGTSRRSSPT